MLSYHMPESLTLDNTLSLSHTHTHRLTLGEFNSFYSTYFFFLFILHILFYILGLHSAAPSLLISKMEQLSVNPAIIKWYSSFLTDRTQCVKVNNCLSEQRKISTGVPQGCVSSPILFTLFTNECSSKHSKNYIFKYSDDTAILSLLDVDDNIGDVYLPEISQFVQWCDKNDLIINIKKTEEIIFDPKGIGDHHQVVIHNQNITQTQTYKYLGVYIDSSLTWKTHTEWVCTRLHQRLYFLRRLRFYGVNKKIMMLFYKAVLESIVKYGVTVWFGNLSIQLKSKLAHLVLTALKIVGHEESLNLQQLFENSTLKQVQKIVEDQTHFLHYHYELLPSGRRYRVPLCKLNRYKNSFVPMSVRMLNNSLSYSF